MRRIVQLIPAVALFVACTKADTPPADTAAMAPAPAPVAAPAPTPVTEEMVSGTWTGTNSPMGSDSIVGHWTQVCGKGSCSGTSQESKITIPSTYTLAGDSAVGQSKPFEDPAMKMPKGTKLIDNWVVHFDGNNVKGTGAMKLASKPDSVVIRYTITGTKKM